MIAAVAWPTAWRSIIRAHRSSRGAGHPADETVWARADARFALGYWPWLLLAQPPPLPERVLTHVAGGIIIDAFSNSGSRPGLRVRTGDRSGSLFSRKEAGRNR